MGTRLHSFPCGYPVAPAPSVENTTLAPLNCVGTLVKSQLTLNVKIYFWTLNSVAPIDMSIVTAEPLPFFVVGFEIRKCEPTNCVLFQDCFGYIGSLEFSYES